MKKKAIITGISGQDGSYLAELLVEHDYDVFGFVRQDSGNDQLKNLDKIKDRVTLISISITDPIALSKEIEKIRPDEFYHLAAYSFVNYDMNDSYNIMNVNFNSTLYILNTLKDTNKDCRVFFAGSSEMFGSPIHSPQTETSTFNPKSIYGIAKLSSYYLIKFFRTQHNLHCSTGIMYNHESPRRGSQFVTKKIVATAVRIKHGLADTLELGNLDAVRDWGYSPDYVEAMRLMLQQTHADDYIVSTGILHSVRNFVEMVFEHVGLDYKDYVKLNEKFYRESEAVPLCGSPEKIKSLGWQHSKDLKEIIVEMVDYEQSKI